MPSLHCRYNDHDGVSNHQPHDCLLNRLFRRRSKKTSKLRVTGLCAGNSPGLVNSPHKGPVTRKMFPFDDVIMCQDLLAWKMLNGCKIYPTVILFEMVLLPISFAPVHRFISPCLFGIACCYLDMLVYGVKLSLVFITLGFEQHGQPAAEGILLRVIFVFWFKFHSKLTISEYWFKYWHGAEQKA